MGDSRLYIVVLEHWLAALRGDATLRSPMFFWPEPGVLGYTDAVVLFVPPYGLARAVGLDRYVAFQVALIVMKAIGFAAMYHLLRKPLRVDRPAALLGAALFTISNAYYTASGHAQLMAVTFVPLVCLLFATYARQRASGQLTTALFALATGIGLLMLLLLTSFYIAWFTIFIGGLFCAVAGLSVALGRRHAIRWSAIPSTLGRAVPDLTLALTVLLASVVPFLWIYLPALGRVGGRPFTEVMSYVAEPKHVLDVGPENMLWGATLTRLIEDPGGSGVFALYELRRGWPPALLAIFAVTMLASIWSAWRAAHRSRIRGRRDWLVLTVGATAALAWALSVKHGGWTPWELVYDAVPGALAIRVPVRINLVLNILVIAVAMIGLTQLRAASAARQRSAPLVPAAFGLLALVLVAEQLNGMQIASIERGRERARLARIEAPPAPCKQFFVTRPQTDSILETAEGQIDAMLIAYDWHIPTLNGWSGNQPSGWNLNMFDPGSTHRAQAWAAAKGVAGNLCALDLETGRWSRVDNGSS